MSINEKFIINLQGKSFVTYEGLLDLAHQKNLKSINVELVQTPSKENNMTAICKATAVTDKGTFIDYGDASPSSVNSKIQPHIIRMASTRAKARALRDLTNVGMTAIEEINLEADNEARDNPFESSAYVPNDFFNEPPTKRQLDTIKKLSDDLNRDIDLAALDKRSAGALISSLLEEKYKRN
ncbi:hypothetical protein [Proteiniborus sp. MB09-C3]|uniref:hypothetical protein n=1 Tax=Proteiniborus sp. MB09-C3 TaxID=3050072 RepID=UPI002554943F|nr:hypothetical protein [Proteiniborus sp. MB09-C3]WIV13525.1 hypothetical protein QO263_07415 [Proteiniborus sp. MB09-C3]